MANATQGVTTINSSTSAANNAVYNGANELLLGRAYPPVNLAAPVAAVMGNLSDVALGVNNDSTDHPIIGSISDRSPNLPSGYNSLGVPTYGSGKRNAVTTWAADTSKLDSSEFQYFQPLAVASKAYNTLT